MFFSLFLKLVLQYIVGVYSHGFTRDEAARKSPKYPELHTKKNGKHNIKTYIY